MKTGAVFLHVPYKGGGTAVTDMIAGHVAFTLATPAELMPHVRDGKARALAVTTPQRTSVAPDVPTAQEAGVPGFEVIGLVRRDRASRYTCLHHCAART